MMLPCPFCGHKAKIKERATVMVSCTNCSACTFQKEDDEMSAINDWNNRAKPTDGDNK